MVKKNHHGIKINLRTSTMANKFELDQAFKYAKSVSETLEVFKTIEKDSRFKQSEKAAYIWSITHKLLECQPCHNPEQVFCFGKSALRILATYADDHKIDCFGLISWKDVMDNTRSHGSSLFVACIWHLLGSCCYDLKRYGQSLVYLGWAEGNLSALEKDYNSRCVKNCVRRILMATQQLLYYVKVAMGKKDEAVVHVREALKFKELMIGGECVGMGDVYVEVYKAYVAAMDADKALPFCLKALESYRTWHGENSREVVLVRVDLGVLYFVVGKNKEGTEQCQLWQSVIRETRNRGDLLKAVIGTAYMLGNFGMSGKAIEYLEVVVSRTGTGGIGRAILYVMMARVYCVLENFDDARKCMGKAESIIVKKIDTNPIFYGLGNMEMSGVYEKMEDFATAISLLKAVLHNLENFQMKFEYNLKNRLYNQDNLGVIITVLVQVNLLHAKCSTRLLSLISIAGREKEEIPYMINVVNKVERTFGRKRIEVGYVCAKLGAALLNSGQEDLDVQWIEKAQDIMNGFLGPHHMDSLRASHTLSETYEKLQRFDRAIEIQQEVIKRLHGLGPSEQQFVDKATELLKRMKERVSACPTRASSHSQDDKDLSAQMCQHCGISDDEIP